MHFIREVMERGQVREQQAEYKVQLVVLGWVMGQGQRVMFVRLRLRM